MSFILFDPILFAFSCNKNDYAVPNLPKEICYLHQI